MRNFYTTEIRVIHLREKILGQTYRVKKHDLETSKPGKN